MDELGRRRWLLGAGAAVTASALWPLSRFVSAEEPHLLHLFVPTLMRTRALESLLQPGFPEIEVNVFARFADFSAAVASRPAVAAVGLANSLEAAGLTPSWQGENQGSSEERYVLLTSGSRRSIEEITEGEIGMVDVVGRRELPGLVQRMLGLQSLPRVRRVLKLGDLLPLLTLGLSTGVLLPERFLPELRAMSRLPLTVYRPSTATLRRTAVAFFGGTGRPHGVEDDLRRAAQRAGVQLGIETWTVS